MATNTEERTLVSLVLPGHLAKLLEQEAKHNSWSIAATVRHIAKWHRGVATSRHPDSKPAKLPARPSKTKVTKGVLMDQEDIDYLDKVRARAGFPRVVVLTIMIFDWFELEAVPRG